jgi:hypothetical protein
VPLDQGCQGIAPALSHACHSRDVGRSGYRRRAWRRLATQDHWIHVAAEGGVVSNLIHERVCKSGSCFLYGAMTKWDVMSFIFRDAIMYFSLDRFDIRAGVIALVPPDLAPGELCSDGNGLGMGAVVVKRDWDRNGQSEADPSQAISIWRSSLHWQHRVTQRGIVAGHHEAVGRLSFRTADRPTDLPSGCLCA